VEQINDDDDDDDDDILSSMLSTKKTYIKPNVYRLQKFLLKDDKLNGLRLSTLIFCLFTRMFISMLQGCVVWRHFAQRAVIRPIDVKCEGDYPFKGLFRLADKRRLHRADNR